MAFLESRGKHNEGAAAAGAEGRLPAAEGLAQRGRRQAAGGRGFPTSSSLQKNRNECPTMGCSEAGCPKTQLSPALWAQAAAKRGQFLPSTLGHRLCWASCCSPGL